MKLSAALVLVIGCSDQTPAAPRTGSLTLIATVHANGTDANGFVVTFGSRTGTLMPNAPLTVTQVPVGPYTVRLSDIAPQCWADADSVTARVFANSTALASLDVTCIGDLAFTVQGTPAQATHIGYLDDSGVIRSLAGDETSEWSPDGSRILFTHGGIFTVALDGTVRQLTDASGDGFAHYSRDGSKILFQRLGSDAASSRVRVMSADGTGDHAVLDSLGSTFLPVWARGDTDVVFKCLSTHLCVAHPDGTGLRDIPTNVIASTTVASPNGGVIAVQAFIGTWVLRVAGAHAADTLAPVTSLSSGQFAWAPSSDQLVVETDTHNPFETNLQLINVDGSGLTMLADSADTRFFSPSWSPDGAWIAFVANQADTAQQIWVMRPDGSDKHRITSNDDFKLAPMWSPGATPGRNDAMASRGVASTIPYLSMTRAP